MMPARMEKEALMISSHEHSEPTATQAQTALTRSHTHGEVHFPWVSMESTTSKLPGHGDREPLCSRNLPKGRVVDCPHPTSLPGSAHGTVSPVSNDKAWQGCSWGPKRQVRAKMADGVTSAQEQSQLCPEENFMAPSWEKKSWSKASHMQGFQGGKPLLYWRSGAGEWSETVHARKTDRQSWQDTHRELLRGCAYLWSGWWLRKNGETSWFF